MGHCKVESNQPANTYKEGKQIQWHTDTLKKDKPDIYCLTDWTPQTHTHTHRKRFLGLSFMSALRQGFGCWLMTSGYCMGRQQERAKANTRDSEKEAERGVKRDERDEWRWRTYNERDESRREKTSQEKGKYITEELKKTGDKGVTKDM